MKLLELFGGTGCVGRVSKDFDFNVVSLDLKGALINTFTFLIGIKFMIRVTLTLFGHPRPVLNIALLNKLGRERLKKQIE